jgi:hypothetical protein
MDLNASLYFQRKRRPKNKGGSKSVIHSNNGPKSGKAKSKDKTKAKDKGKEVDNVKKGPEVDNKRPNFIKGCKVPQRNLPRNYISHTFHQEKEVSDYPDFDKIDTINIAPEMVYLMNIYSRLREMDKGDILIEHLELLLAMSTHMRNRDSKISRAHNGKTMSDWVCFNKIQDKIWHFLRGGNVDNYVGNIEDFEIIKDHLGYEIDFPVVTPDSKQSRDSSSEMSHLTDDNLTSQALENRVTSSNKMSDDILSPMKIVIFPKT